MNTSSELVVYKASAGSGKTFTLAVEYIKLLIRNPRAYRNILAVTFTNKATAEMKERILSQLYGIYIGDKDSDPYLENVCKSLNSPIEEIRTAAGKALNYIIHDYSHFRVETIDSFFQSVMRNLARELELNANLSIELNNADVLSEAVDAMIEKLDRNSPVLSWLLEYIEERIRNDRRWNVANEIKNFGRNIFDEGYIEKGAGLRNKLKDKDCIGNYRRMLKAIREEALEQMKGFSDQFIGVLESAGLSPLDLKNGARGIAAYFKKITDGTLTNDVRNITVEKCLLNPEEWSAKTSPYKAGILSIAETELIPLLQECENFRIKNNIIVNSCELSLRHINNLRLLANIDEEVRIQNRENNRFLLSDTNALLHSLIKDGDSSFVFEKIGSNIRNVMIDEFQDTSRMQWDNFKLLLLEGLSQGADSLIVGDVKQSIYRWRNGDWGILNGLKGQINAFPIRTETLKINRRSESNIIDFNNQIFTEACGYLNNLYRQEQNDDCQELQKAYSDVKQESPKKQAKGYVKVSFLDGDHEKSYTEQTLENLATEIKHLIDAGVQQSDIAILVRKNKNIPQIADYFDKNLPYRIVSDEAFRLDASLAICMLLDGLRYLSDPENKIPCAQLAVSYQNEVLHQTINLNTLLINQVEDYLPKAFIENVNTLRLMPLYELIEKLFGIFGLERIDNQDAYLFAFFDAVLEYLQAHSSDIDSFISFWDETLCSKTIPSGEIEGIRILSIHKSKGLEFHTVIIPFCDWKMENETNNQLVWCTPEEAPFNDLDIVPVNYSAAMAQSIYQRDYQHEKLQLWVDNLNLLYVAFTRAEKNLIVFSKAEQRGTVSELLYQSLSGLAGKKNEDWNGEIPYEFGSLCLSEHKKIEKKTNRLTASSLKRSVKMESFKHKIEFKQSNRSAQFIRGEENKTEQYISQGQLLHTLFSAIETTNDIDTALDRLLFEGVIKSHEQIEKLKKFVCNALSNPQVSKWYSGEYRLFNECEIVYKENGMLQTRRPDRVMMKDNKVIVLDFKFGKQKPEYAKQVQGYMSLLASMGYTHIQGYLWYVFENKLEEIGR